MRIATERSCDVLVVGSGIAGCMAAIAAAETGARVCLASTGPLFSGSSFFEGTWGLGCIAADGAADEDDLVATILRVGCGQADEALVRTLVHGIPAALADLERRGAKLRVPDVVAEREYIPCFDHVHRLWRGLGRTALRTVFARELDRLDVEVLPRCTLADLAEGGAVLAHGSGCPFAVSAPAAVLATGGMSGLYGRHLTRDDCLGTAQALALAHGARLANIEFMQIMPTVLTPKGPVVFNEKCFRFSTLSIPVDDDLLDERSTYGPFTSRLASSAVDLAIARAGEPVYVRVDRLPSPAPEFIETYRRWYEGATGLPIEEPVPITHFAHASNGGIAIDEHAWCGVPGLFAAGECTGGMHGADRIGGLASANALVFGRIAGTNAASFAAACRTGRPFVTVPGSPSVRHDPEIGRILDKHALVIRTGAGLSRAAEQLAALDPSPQRTSAQALVSAMLARTQSCGSHFRADEPAVCG